MAEANDLDRAISTMCLKFTISRLNAFQMKAISEFVKGKSDIFVSLPTGCVDTGVDVESGALNACLTSSAPEYCGDVHAKGFPKNTAGRL